MCTSNSEGNGKSRFCRLLRSGAVKLTSFIGASQSDDASSGFVVQNNSIRESAPELLVRSKSGSSIINYTEL